MDTNPQPQPQPPPYPPQPPYPPRQAYPPRQPYPPAYDEPPPGGGDDDASGLEAKLWILRLSKAVVFFLYVVVTAALVLLTLAFVLELFGANPEADFADWVYEHAARVMEPFRGLFEHHTIDGNSVVDFSLLFAMILYAMVAIGLHALVVWLTNHVIMANKNIAWHQHQQALARRQRVERRPPGS